MDETAISSDEVAEVTAMKTASSVAMAQKTCGALDIACTGGNIPMLAGNVAALLSPVVFIPVLTLIFGRDKYDWKSMMAIRKGDDHDLAAHAGLDLENTVGGHVETAAEFEAEQTKLLRASKISKWTTAGLTLAFLILWPFPMYGSGYIFSKPFFTGWVTIGIIWIFCSLGAVGIFPVFEGRRTLGRTAVAIFNDITGRKKPTRTIHAQEGSGVDTPPTKEVQSKEPAKESVLDG